jgi:hypothetical protein
MTAEDRQREARARDRLAHARRLLVEHPDDEALHTEERRLSGTVAAYELKRVLDRAAMVRAAPWN